MRIQMTIIEVTKQATTPGAYTVNVKMRPSNVPSSNAFNPLFWTHGYDGSIISFNNIDPSIGDGLIPGQELYIDFSTPPS